MFLCHWKWWVVLLLNDLFNWALMFWLGVVLFGDNPNLTAPSFIVTIIWCAMAILFINCEFLILIGSLLCSAPVLGCGLLLRIILQSIQIPWLLWDIVYSEILAPPPCSTFCIPYLTAAKSSLFTGLLVAGSIFASVKVYDHYLNGLGGHYWFPLCRLMPFCPVHRTKSDVEVQQEPAPTPRESHVQHHEDSNPFHHHPSGDLEAVSTEYIPS